jgi:hypothetical protein
MLLVACGDRTVPEQRRCRAGWNQRLTMLTTFTTSGAGPGVRPNPDQTVFPAMPLSGVHRRSTSSANCGRKRITNG